MIDFILHFDKHLEWIVQNYGTMTYLILFAIIFIETGLVVMPFLPGDSLLFVAGAMAYKGSLDIYTLLITLFLAAVLGDTVNYLIGKFFAPQILSLRIGRHQLVKQAHLDKTHAFLRSTVPKPLSWPALFLLCAHWLLLLLV